MSVHKEQLWYISVNAAQSFQVLRRESWNHLWFLPPPLTPHMNTSRKTCCPYLLKATFRIWPVPIGGTATTLILSHQDLFNRLFVITFDLVFLLLLSPFPATIASLLFLQPVSYILTSGPLRWLFLQAEKLPPTVSSSAPAASQWDPLQSPCFEVRSTPLRV